jgi:hypothetical protein
MAKTMRAKKLARDLRRVKRDLKSKPATRRNATKALAQAAMAAPRRNFGTKSAGGTLRACIKSLDARVPRTIGLPRAVGPYSVIRTTRLWSSSANFIMFVPFSNGTSWYNWCGVEGVVSSNAVNATDNTRPIPIPLAELSQAAEVVPAALTVQVMNPSSLQTADGMFAMGRANQQFNYGGSSVPWDELRARFISFFTPQSLEFLITVEWRVRFDPGNPAVASHSHHDTTSDGVWNSVCREMSSAGHGVEELAEDVMELGAMGGAARLAATALL